jgi:hypothetical protein
MAEDVIALTSRCFDPPLIVTPLRYGYLRAVRFDVRRAM